jgi:hypothetical protein
VAGQQVASSNSQDQLPTQSQAAGFKSQVLPTTHPNSRFLKEPKLSLDIPRRLNRTATSYLFLVSRDFLNWPGGRAGK